MSDMLGKRRFSRASRVLIAVLTLTFAAAAALPPASHADPVEPRARDRQVTLAVYTLLQHEHLLKHPLDDEISQRGLKKFLEMLDPMKFYFLQSDIDEFMQHRNDLDDQLKRGDITFAYHIFNRFLKRVDERVTVVDELLERDFDFTKDEEMVTDADLISYPTDGDQAADRWRKKIKYDLLMLKVDGEEADEARKRLTRRYHSYAKRMHQIDEDELMEMYISAMTRSFDPHTLYMSPTSFENFNIDMRLTLEGIGASLRLEDGYTIVTKIIPGGAADKEGSLQPEDRVVSVGEGEDGEMVDVVDLKLSDVVDMIRGKAGTVVRLGVRRTGQPDIKTITITRAKIELKDREAQSRIFDAGQGADGQPYKVGVIDLPAFYMDMSGARSGLANFKSTTRDVKKILDNFKEEGVEALVLDLRRNGGGSLTEAIKLTGLFIDRGPVLQVKDSEQQVLQYDDLDAGMEWERPLVVVTSKESASASEILAGAIQDYDRGLIVGDKATHGKGTVQSLLEIGPRLFRIPQPPNLGALKITMQQFYRPAGDSTQQRGVMADVVLPSLTTHMDIAERDSDYAIPFDRVPAAEHDMYDFVDADMVAKLRQRSEGRIDNSEEFSKLMEKIVYYREQKARKRVSLNEEKFIERRERFNAEEEERKLREEEMGEDSEAIERDYYFDEVLAITADYLDVLDRRRLAEHRARASGFGG